jgi:hypothetical protein
MNVGYCTQNTIRLSESHLVVLDPETLQDVSANIFILNVYTAYLVKDLQG